MLLLLSVGNVLTGGFQLSAQEQSKRFVSFQNWRID